jgi:hypothetical protein
MIFAELARKAVNVVDGVVHRDADDGRGHGDRHQIQANAQPPWPARGFSDH